MDLNRYITITHDFPKKGITFLSYTTLLRDPVVFHEVIRLFAERYRNQEIDCLVGLESRGFIFAAALGYALNLPFVMIRKAGKLPGAIEHIDFALEYGEGSFEIEKKSLKPQEKVVIIDDVFATGHTAQAAIELVERLHAEVLEIAVLIELTSLKGQMTLSKPLYSLLKKELNSYST